MREICRSLHCRYVHILLEIECGLNLVGARSLVVITSRSASEGGICFV